MLTRIFADFQNADIFVGLDSLDDFIPHTASDIGKQEVPSIGYPLFLSYYFFF